MKFVYEYRTSENELRSGFVSAASRDAAYAALRLDGIRPSRMKEAPGFFNWLSGRGRRYWAVTLLLGIAVAAVGVSVSMKAELENVQAVFEEMERRQIIGDATYVEKEILTGWSSVFEHEGERFLAGFAVPGVSVSVRNTTEEEIVAALKRSVPPHAGDSIEARQIKSIVEGMKQELRRFLAQGGTIVEYGKRLVERQEREIAYYNRAKNEIGMLKRNGADDKAVMSLWEMRNANLRAMGIRQVAFPE